MIIVDCENSATSENQQFAIFLNCPRMQNYTAFRSSATSSARSEAGSSLPIGETVIPQNPKMGHLASLYECQLLVRAIA
jgi:hypothetical protein